MGAAGAVGVAIRVASGAAIGVASGTAVGTTGGVAVKIPSKIGGATNNRARSTYIKPVFIG